MTLLISLSWQMVLTKKNMPISGAVPEIQNKDHSRQGDSSRGRETFPIIIIFKQGAF